MNYLRGSLLEILVRGVRAIYYQFSIEIWDLYEINQIQKHEVNKLLKDILH